jgi:hypothetical protein
VISPFKIAQIGTSSTPASKTMVNWSYSNWVGKKAKCIHAPVKVIQHFDNAFVEELSADLTHDQMLQEFQVEFCETEDVMFKFFELENFE